jgi:hypothetical protein
MRQLRQLVQRYPDMAALHGSMYQYAVNCALVQSCTGIAAAQDCYCLQRTSCAGLAVLKPCQHVARVGVADNFFLGPVLGPLQNAPLISTRRHN